MDALLIVLELLYTRLIAVFKPKCKQVRNGDPIYEVCIPLRIPLAWRTSKVK